MALKYDQKVLMKELEADFGNNFIKGSDFGAKKKGVKKKQVSLTLLFKCQSLVYVLIKMSHVLHPAGPLCEFVGA